MLERRPFTPIETRPEPQTTLRWTVGRKMALGFGVVLLVVAAGSVARFISSTTINEKFKKTVDDVIVELAALGQIEALSLELLGETREYLLFGEASTLEELEESKQQLDQALAAYAGAGEELEGEEEEQKELGLARDIETAIGDVETASAGLIALYDAGAGQQELKEAGEQLEADEAALEAALEKAQEALFEEIEETQATVDTTTRTELLVSVVGPAAILLFFIVTAYLLTRSITWPVKNLERTARLIADGDLEQVAKVRGSDEIGALAMTFNRMTTRMRALLQSLEQRRHRLERQTNYLLAASTVTTAMSLELALETLLPRIVNLISGHFGFYHTGLFLLDPLGEWAVLQAASSKEGLRLLANDYRLPVGERGIVGQVVSQGKHRVALSSGAGAMSFVDTEWPATRSEIALPLRVRGQIIGVLDLQSQDPEVFGDEDVVTLQTLADQVAATIDNTRLFQQVQESLAAERRAYGELSGAAWRELLQAQTGLGFVKEKGRIAPAGQLWEAQMEAVLHTGRTTPGDAAETSIVIPIKVRDKVIGVIKASNPDRQGQWTPEQIELLEDMTNQVGIALESARLYQDTQRRAAQDRFTTEITARIRAESEIDAVLQRALEELSRVLGAERAVAHLSLTDNGKR